jgi:hypothetical protein
MGGHVTRSVDAHDDVAAMQTCLAAEHAAVYAYGLVGGRLAGLRAPSEVVRRTAESYEWHRAQRDALDQSIRDLGGEPVAAEPAYDVPSTPTTVGQCARLARSVENRCCETYAYSVSIAAEPIRGRLAAQLGAVAVRAAAWGARLAAFPGRPDL